MENQNGTHVEWERTQKYAIPALILGSQKTEGSQLFTGMLASLDDKPARVNK